MDTVYLQTYSLGPSALEDFPSALKKVAEIGYTGIEFAGYGGLSVCEMKALLKSLDLDPISSHVGLDAVEKDIPYLKELGVPYVICPMVPLATIEDVHNAAKEFNRIGKLCKEAGLRFGYHNHTGEFAVFDGKYAEEILMEETDPEYVCFEIDCGWATCAGVDAAAFLEKYADRFELIHVKETNAVTGVQKPINFKDLPRDENGRPILPQEVRDELAAVKRTNCPTGKGIIDWKKIKAVGDRIGIKAYIVEREYDYKGGDIYGCVAEDLAALKEI